MSTITFEAIKARQDELATMIEQFGQQQAVRSLQIEGITIELDAGEHYAGAVLAPSGNVIHHLVLMAARPDSRLTWDGAVAWAESVGGWLPTRQEQALLFANCKPHLQPEWHWSGQAYETDASFAWDCLFLSGNQGYGRKSYEGCAVAVRRV